LSAKDESGASMADPRYLLDSTVLIDLCDHFRRPAIERALALLARHSCLKIPEGVRRELERMSDNAHSIVENLVGAHADCLVQVSRVPNLGEELVRVERQYGERIQGGSRQYPGFWKSARGRKAVDGQVVAMARRLGCTAVSDDKAVQLACLLENTSSMGWTEFARTIGLHSQLSLF